MATGKSTLLNVSDSARPEPPTDSWRSEDIGHPIRQKFIHLHDEKQCTIALDKFRADISSLSMRLHREEQRSLEFRKMYLALELVYITLDKESHTSSADQALVLAKQALDLAEQTNHHRLLRKYQQRENDLLELIPKMIGPQMIASYNWRDLIRENAAGKDKVEELESDIKRQRESHNERVKEQNAEIEDLNQEITYLRAQLPATENPHKGASSSGTEQTRPVDDTYEFAYCYPGQMRYQVRGRWKKLRKVS